MGPGMDSPKLQALWFGWRHHRLQNELTGLTSLASGDFDMTKEMTYVFCRCGS